MSAQDTVIQFDDLPAGTVVSDQYQSQGVVFFTPPGGGILPVIVLVPAGEAHSGNQVASISTCEDCEFPVPFIRGRFTNTVERISMFVGQFDGMPASAQLTLTAFDAGGTILAQSPPVMVTTGGGFNARISVEVPAATIASFEISGQAGPDSGKQVGIDDLTFGRTQDAPPDFSLLPAQTVLEVAQGASTNDTIALARFNGSTGPIQCTVSGLPPGVTADFQPDPVSSESTLLTLSADVNAPLTGSAFAPVTITATPLSHDAGSGARTTQVSVAVRADFTLAVDGSDQVYLAACGTTSITLRVIRAIAFQSVEIGLSVVGLPPGMQATLTPSSVGAPPDGGLVNVVTLSLAVVDQQVLDTDITI